MKSSSNETILHLSKDEKMQDLWVPKHPLNHNCGPLDYKGKRISNSVSSELLVYNRLSLISYILASFPIACTIMLGASPLLSILSATLPFRPASSLTLINIEASNCLLCNVNISMFILPDHLSLQTPPLAFL